jgi:amino acid adenylation domain-containing protein
MTDSLKHGFKLPPEQRAIRAKCFHPTGTFVEFKREEVEQSIPQRFEKIVRMYPDRIAVKSKSLILTYDELNKAANRIARVIVEKRGEGSEPIALLIEQSASLIAAIVGILKAGKIYVPLDRYYPQSRLTSMLEDFQSSPMVTNDKNLSLARKLVPDASRIINIDEIDSNFCADSLDQFISPDSLAWIIFTSGSTGKPKGVMQTHRNVLQEIMNYTNGARICHDDRLVLISSPSFGDAVRTRYAALLNGAALYPLDIKEKGMAALVDWLIQQEITVYRSVPSVFRYLASALKRGEAVPKLRLVYLAGDSVFTTDIDLYKKHFPQNCILINGLGSTETLTFRWYFIDKETQFPGNGVPVGYPVQDKQVLLLNDASEEVGFNSVGEMSVKSRYLSPGYWGRNDLTETAFVSDPKGGKERIYRTGDIGYLRPDGCLEHRGRKDSQVKVRGNRIEVAEIETALLSLGTIKEAIVSGRADQDDGNRLVAYLVLAGETRPTVTMLRRILGEKLPEYMIPSGFVFLDVLPLSANGKVDRRALPDPGNSRPNLDTPYAAPRTPIQKELAQIWDDVLSLDQVGIHDNFFDLGGHSLAASRVISRVIQTFQLDIPLRSLFDSPTVAEMARVITMNQARKASQEELERMLREVEAVSEEEAKTLLAKENGRS